MDKETASKILLDYVKWAKDDGDLNSPFFVQYSPEEIIGAMEVAGNALAPSSQKPYDKGSFKSYLRGKIQKAKRSFKGVDPDKFLDEMRGSEPDKQTVKDILAKVETWLRGNLHHLSCWNVDEFCISLRTYFGLE